MDSNIVLIDWVSISTKELDKDGVIALLGFGEIPWQSIKGMYGYQDRLNYEGVNIHYNGRDDMGVLLELSGQGCRTFESLGNGDFERLWKFVLSGHGNITRLDIAYDDHSGILDMDKLFSDSYTFNYVSKSDSFDFQFSNKGKTIYHGSEKSEIRLRIYDKAKERHCEEGTHWIRAEFQLRRDRARKFLELDGTYGERFAGIMLNYLRYVEPQEDDSNKWRWPLTDYWAEFLQDAVRISLYEKPGMEYNIDRLDNLVFHQLGNAVNTAMQIYGYKGFMDKLRDMRPKPNPKYDLLINKVYHLTPVWEELD